MLRMTAHAVGVRHPVVSNTDFFFRFTAGKPASNSSIQAAGSFMNSSGQDRQCFGEFNINQANKLSVVQSFLLSFGFFKEQCRHSHVALSITGRQEVAIADKSQKTQYRKNTGVNDKCGPEQAVLLL